MQATAMYFYPQALRLVLSRTIMKTGETLYYPGGAPCTRASFPTTKSAN